MIWKYQILSHPADVKLQITATTKEELFQAALSGMTAILYPSNSPQKVAIKDKIKIHSLDLNTLLVDFLNEVLAKNDIFKAVFKTLTINTLTDTYLEAEIFGNHIHALKQEIKAATHHGLKITQDQENNYHATILFDI
ncbi:MAG: archease [Parcubacteria group bacterium]|nr:archease [Parcubacteria group bacterium]